MLPTTISDTEFIKLWNDLQSPQAVADALDVGVRNVYKRRKRIEELYAIRLPVAVKEIRASTNAVVKVEYDDAVILVGSDAHLWPGERTTMQRAFVYFAEHYRPRINCVVLNGDAFDGARVSRHPTIGWEKRPTVKDELDTVKEFLQDIQAVAGSAKRFWTLGNHDLRFETRIANQLPEYAEVQGVHLKDHFPGWQPCWRLDVNDDIIIRHRELGGEHADFRNVLTAGKTMVTGHDHRTGVTPYRNYCGLHYGVRTGYMGDSPLDPQFVHYLEAKEPNWHPAFVVLTIKNGLLLYPELCTKLGEGLVQFRGNTIKV